jgi:hypothetical protein
MATKKKLNEELEDILARIGKAKRELKALRRRQAEGAKGKPGAGFITGKEGMIEVEEAVKRLDILNQREREIRDKLQSSNH